MNYEITFFLGGRRKPSTEHTFQVVADNPVTALYVMLQTWPAAMMPFKVSPASGQGEGHKPL